MFSPHQMDHLWWHQWKDVLKMNWTRVKLIRKSSLRCPGLTEERGIPFNSPTRFLFSLFFKWWKWRRLLLVSFLLSILILLRKSQLSFCSLFLVITCTTFPFSNGLNQNKRTCSHPYKLNKRSIKRWIFGQNFKALQKRKFDSKFIAFQFPFKPLSLFYKMCVKRAEKVSYYYPSIYISSCMYVLASFFSSLTVSELCIKLAPSWEEGWNCTHIFRWDHSTRH